MGKQLALCRQINSGRAGMEQGGAGEAEAEGLREGGSFAHSFHLLHSHLTAPISLAVSTPAHLLPWST